MTEGLCSQRLRRSVGAVRFPSVSEGNADRAVTRDRSSASATAGQGSGESLHLKGFEDPL